jgi:hypothetical protein
MPNFSESAGVIEMSVRVQNELDVGKLEAELLIFGLVCPVASGMAVSMRMFPAGPVIRYEAMPLVPT